MLEFEPLSAGTVFREPHPLHRRGIAPRKVSTAIGFALPVYELHFLCETSFGISDSRGACSNRLRAETDPSLGFGGRASAYGSAAADAARHHRLTSACGDGESAP